ncbi:MAG: hypothetical protein IPJ65_41595 [Archangiaceae bacterium]|nr:hypothetical protein [Archangiaceae bacterium]
MFKPLISLAVLALCACGSAAEIRVGKAQGIPQLKGSKDFDLGTFNCGDTFSSDGYTVTSAKVGTDCELTFDQQVTLIRQSDYESIPDLKGTSNLVQAVELEVTQLAFADGTGTALDLNGYVKTVELKVEGQKVADKSTLASLPTTVRLEGDALNTVKQAVAARTPAVVHATAVLVVPQSPAPPAHIKIDYDAQPTLVLGTGKINLGQ